MNRPRPQNRSQTGSPSDSQTDSQAPPQTALTWEKCRARAFEWLARREYSAQALQEKLIEAGATENMALQVVTELGNEGYQSDARVAAMAVRAALRKGLGQRRIAEDFRKRQLDSAQLPAELEAVNWLEQAVQTRIRKFGTDIPADAKEKARQFRFLQYRGFSSEVCAKALKLDRWEGLD